MSELEDTNKNHEKTHTTSVSLSPSSKPFVPLFILNNTAINYCKNAHIIYKNCGCISGKKCTEYDWTKSDQFKTIMDSINITETLTAKANLLRDKETAEKKKHNAITEASNAEKAKYKAITEAVNAEKEKYEAKAKYEKAELDKILAKAKAEKFEKEKIEAIRHLEKMEIKNIENKKLLEIKIAKAEKYEAKQIAKAEKYKESSNTLKLCKSFINGLCPLGKACSFVHFTGNESPEIISKILCPYNCNCSSFKKKGKKCKFKHVKIYCRDKDECKFLKTCTYYHDCRDEGKFKSEVNKSNEEQTSQNDTDSVASSSNKLFSDDRSIKSSDISEILEDDEYEQLLFLASTFHMDREI
jgi:hypothetical protein